MGSRRDRPLRVPPGLDDHDRLDPRGGAGRRHELAGIVDRLDVEQDGPRAAVDGEIVEQIAEIDIDLVSERDHRRKTNRRLAAHSTKPAAMAPDCEIKREVAAPRHACGKAGIELHWRDEYPETIGTDEPDARCAGRAFGGFGKRACAVTET